MRVIITLTILLAAVISCQKPEQIGVLVDFNGTLKDTLYLRYLKSAYEQSDTATLRKDGVYYFNFSNKPYGCYRLVADSLHTFDFVYDKDTLIKINAILTKIEYATFSGSNSTKMVKEAGLLLNAFEKDLDTLFYQLQITNPDQLPISKRDSLMRQIDTIRVAYKLLTDSIINYNQGNFGNILIMNHKSNNIPLYNVYQDYDRYNEVAETILAKYPNNETAIGYKQNLALMQQPVTRLKSLKAGRIMMEMEIRINDSTFVNLSQQKQHRKAVFIHSYSTDFNIQTSDLSVVQALKQKGFEIYEASTDSIIATAKESWTKGVINKPENYFNNLPLPIILLMEANDQIIYQTPYITDLKEQIPNL